MKRICPYCGRIVDGSHNCEHKPKDNRHKSIHNAKWRQVANEVKRRDLCCLMCWSNGILTNKHLEAHHIKWREVDDSEENLLDESGIITLCSECHHEIHRHPMKEYYNYLKGLIKNRDYSQAE